MFLSIVIPTYKSSAFIKKSIREIHYFLEENHLTFEIIIVNDSGDYNTWDKLKEISKELKNIKVYNLYKNFGQHYSNHIGFIKSKGDFIITMDDDSQNPPDQILKLLEEITKSKVDLVVGVYEERKHTAVRLISSKLMNFLIKKFLRLKKF